MDEIRRVIVNHCSPVLLGCKPAALFTLRPEKALAVLAGLLRPRITLSVVRKNRGGLLVLAFDRARLEQTVLNRDALAVLAGMGYPAEASLAALLDYLRGQFVRSDFPHEIGLFLGYPVEDVLGFVRHKGRYYKCCGYWKVYGDVEHAKQCFRRYDTCRECFETIFKEFICARY